MKSYPLLGLAWSIGIAWSAFSMAFSQPVDLKVHPRFDIAALRPAGFEPPVSGLALLPGGDLLVSTWDGFGAAKGKIYLLKNAATGDAKKVTYATFADKLDEPLGILVSDGEIYAMEKDSLVPSRYT